MQLDSLIMPQLDDNRKSADRSHGINAKSWPRQATHTAIQHLGETALPENNGTGVAGRLWRSTKKEVNW